MFYLMFLNQEETLYLFNLLYQKYVKKDGTVETVLNSVQDIVEGEWPVTT